MNDSCSLPLKIKCLSLLYFLLASSCLYSQSKTDTLYYSSSDKKIQSIIEITGNKKIVTLYYHSGSQQSRMHYLNNKREGTTTSWYENGAKQEESLYSKDAVIKRKQWSQGEILLKEENYTLIQKDSIWRSELGGKYVSYYGSGLPMSEGTYQNNKKNGEWTEFYENGKKKSTINYKNDIREGKSTYWSKSEKLSGEYSFAIDTSKGKPREIKHGKHIRYFDSGNMAERFNYKMGKKDGLGEEWHENGNKKSEIDYKDDMINGKNRAWLPNGNIQQDIFFTMVFDSVKKYNRPRYEGKFEMHHDNGNLKISGNYVNGKEDGLFVNYYDNGQKASEVTHKNGLKVGPSLSWHKNGAVYLSENYIIIKENDSVKSLQDGAYKRFLDNNTLVDNGTFTKGKKEGTWTQWYPDGKKAEESNYCKGMRCGKSTWWNKDGTLKQEQSYAVVTINGVSQSLQEGEDKTYDSKGILKTVRYFNRKNYCYKTEEFYEDGTLKAIHCYLAKSRYDDRLFGKSITYFSNGQVESEGFYHNSRPFGRMVSYYINGNLKSVTDNDGSGRGIIKAGYDIQWTSDGELASFRKSTGKDFEKVKDPALAKSIFENYVNRPKTTGAAIAGKKEGVWLSWFEKDYKQFKENFKNGKLDGKFIAYYGNGEKMFEMDMKEDIANGPFTFWNLDKTKNLEGFFLDGAQDGLWINYFPNGNKREETQYEAGQPFYVSHKEWQENGFQKSESNYRNGKENGRFAQWQENGKLSSEGFLRDGKNDSLYRNYHPNGNLKEESPYKKGKHEGLSTYWYESGKKERVLMYKDGEKNGKFIRWWENGNLHTEGLYKNDESDSTWSFYLEDGKLNYQNKYKKGVLVKDQTGYACECIDSAKGKISFAPLLSDLASLAAVRRMSFNFHSPVGSFYNHLFYINLQFDDGGRDASFYSFDIVAYQQMYLRVPDKNGIKLILNPCINTGRLESRINFSVNLEKENKQNTRVSLYPKHLSIEFNPALLHQWDKKSGAPFPAPPKKAKTEKDEERDDDEDESESKFVPAVLQFKTTEVEYNERDHLKISKPSEPCFTTAEIGNSGILLDFKSIVLDMDVVKAPPEMEFIFPEKYYEYFYASRKYPEAKGSARDKKDKLPGTSRESFVGVFVAEAEITLPTLMFSKTIKKSVVVKGKDFMLSGQYIIGTIHIKAELADGLNYTTVQPDSSGEKAVFSAVFIQQAFESQGLHVAKTEYNSTTSEFLIYIYYPYFK